jgi:hypothetical protein
MDLPKRRRPGEEVVDDVEMLEGDATGGIIPYKNPSALIAYYCGLFSLFPILGVFLGDRRPHPGDSRTPAPQAAPRDPWCRPRLDRHRHGGHDGGDLDGSDRADRRGRGRRE